MRQTNHKEDYQKDRSKTHFFASCYYSCVHRTESNLKMKAYSYMILANISQYVASIIAVELYHNAHPRSDDKYNDVHRVSLHRNPCIYVLLDPRTDNIVYVGSTDKPQSRKGQHLKNGTGSKDYMAWKKELFSLGLKPVFKIHKTYGNIDFAGLGESALIKELKEKGTQLLNIRS